MTAVNVGLAVLARDGTVRTANPAMLRLTGLTRGRIVKRRLDEVVSEDHESSLTNWLTDPHTACSVDLEFVAGDGSTSRLTGWLNPLAPGDGDPDDHAALQLVPREVSVDLTRQIGGFAAVADDLSDAVVVTDAELTVVQANLSAAVALDGVHRGEALPDLLGPGAAHQLADALRTGHADGIHLSFERAGVGYALTGRELRDSSGQLVGFSFVLTRSGNEEPPRNPATGKQPATASAEQAALAVLDASDDIVWIFDIDGPIAASAAARRLSGAPRGFEGVTLSTLFTPASARMLVRDGLAHLAPGGSWTADLTMLDADSASVEVGLTLRHHPQRDGVRETWSLMAVPASDTAPDEGLLRDPSTGLPTAATLSDRLELSIDRATRSGRRTCLVALQIDGFADLGPAIGDEVTEALVVETSRALRAAVRPGDTLARTSQAVFEVVRDDVTDIRDAERFAERLRVTLDEPVELDGVRWYLSLSAGAALTQPGVTNVSGLRRNATTALTQSIAEGGAHTVVFGRALNENGRPTKGRTGAARPPTQRSQTRHGSRIQGPRNDGAPDRIPPVAGPPPGPVT